MKKKAADASTGRARGKDKLPASVQEAKTVISPDVLDRETSLSAVLEENGIKVKAKSRTVAALDRLLGNLVDLPSIFLEPSLNRRRDNEALKGEIRRIESEKAIEAARQGPANFGTISYPSEDFLIRERNKLAIGIKTVGYLKALPPPEQQQPDFDPDWLNDFADIAAKKSNAEIQDLWARLLAGEIRNPGSFNLRSMNKLSLIDSL